jgi:hypothetical protein
MTNVETICAFAYAVVFDNMILKFTLANSAMESKIKYVASGSHKSWNDALENGYTVHRIRLEVV